ncbi:MAG: hypothetical protein ACO1N3_03510 [Gammaproteobacteria bacterium]
MTPEESAAISAHKNLPNLARGLENIVLLSANMPERRLERIRHVLLFNVKLEQLSKEDYLDVENDINPNSHRYHDSDQIPNPPTDRLRLFSLISFLQKILGPGHALYRLNDMLAYSPASQLFLGMRKLCQMHDHYLMEAKLACIDSLIESNEIAHLRAHTIIYFQSTSILSGRIVYYLAQFKNLPKSKEQVYDHIFSKLNTIKYRDENGINLVFSHQAPEKLFLGLERILKHYSTSQHDLDLIQVYIQLVLEEQTSPEIIADIVIRLGEQAFSNQNILQELERLLNEVNQELKAYQSYWEHQKLKADEEHTIFMNHIKFPYYSLHLREKALDKYVDFQEYSEKIYCLEYLGDKYQTYQNKLENLKMKSQQRFSTNWVDENISHVENQSYQARLRKIEELESQTHHTLRLRLKDLISLIRKLKKKIAAEPSRKEPARSSPLLANCKWANNVENMTIAPDDTSYENSLR